MTSKRAENPWQFFPKQHPLLQGGAELRSSFSEEDIRKIVKGVAEKINQDLRGEEVVVLGVLKGCLLFLADIIRHFDFRCEAEFIRLASYHGTESSGHVQVIKDIEKDLEGKHVLVLEEIVDTGRTLHWLKNRLGQCSVKSVRIACLFDKKSQRVVELEPDYVGEIVPDYFLLGYGLDLDEYGRNLGHVVSLIQDSPST
jgi:hypoxanthine phosphoribosyltransferase